VNSQSVVETTNASGMMKSLLHGLLTFSILICLHAGASEDEPFTLYEVITETIMPHLEENLRYATTRHNRCLNHRELFSAFPVLDHPSLKGCKLENKSRLDDTDSYLLICEGGGGGTTGAARWSLGAGKITGTLDVKLGGKNMTFYQRITATRLGQCMPEAR
jgi:hypothetical protein